MTHNGRVRQGANLTTFHFEPTPVKIGTDVPLWVGGIDDGKVKGMKIIRGAVGLNVFQATLDGFLNAGETPGANAGK